MTEFSINLEFAQRAFNGTSFNPERRGELFVKDFDDLLLRIKNKIFSDKILLDGQKQEIYERIASKLKVLAEKYLSAESRHVSVMIAGPAKFPVARQQKVMRSVEKNLNEYVDRIEWLQNGGLSKILYRNYPDEAKKDLEDKEDEKKLMVNAKIFVENKISEKDPEVFTFNAFPHLKGCFETCAKHKSFNACRKCIEFLESQLDFCRIQRNITILKRILSEAEEKSAQTPEKSVKQQDFKHFTVIENEQINRYQIIFGGKPAPEIIKNLKENGFKWVPSQKAWQRQITINGKLAIKRFAEFMETIDDD